MVSAFKVAIVRSGLPQFEVARRAKLSETVVSRIAAGRRAATPEERRRLARALGLGEAELFRTDEPGHADD